MTLPVILRPSAEADIVQICNDLDAVRAGLCSQFRSRLSEVLQRIELNPEQYGRVWRDVRAARLRKFRYVAYYIILTDRVDVLAILHGARDSSTWQMRS